MKWEWKTCLRWAGAAFLLYLAIHYWDGLVGILLAALGAATPLVVGCIMAFIVNIPMSFYERHYFPGSDTVFVKKSRRPVCMLLALLSGAAVVTILVCIVAPEVAQCVSLLAARVPDTLKQIGYRLSNLDWLPPEIVAYLRSVQWQDIFSKLQDFLLHGFGSAADVVGGVISTAITTVTSLVLGFVFAVYILLSKEKLARQMKAVAKRYVKRGSWLDKTGYVLELLGEKFHLYIVGQGTEAVILGTLCALGLVILRMPYATVIGATVGFSALIPVAGAYIGGAVGFLLILTVSPWQAVGFLVYLVVLQQIEGNVIYPKVVGTSMGLPGIWVLTAVIIGGGMGGLGGMVLSVPLAATCYRLLSEDVKKGAPENKG